MNPKQIVILSTINNKSIVVIIIIVTQDRVPLTHSCTSVSLFCTLVLTLLLLSTHNTPIEEQSLMCAPFILCNKCDDDEHHYTIGGSCLFSLSLL